MLPKERSQILLYSGAKGRSSLSPNGHSSLQRVHFKVTCQGLEREQHRSPSSLNLRTQSPFTASASERKPRTRVFLPIPQSPLFFPQLLSLEGAGFLPSYFSWVRTFPLFLPSSSSSYNGEQSGERDQLQVHKRT